MHPKSFRVFLMICLAGLLSLACSLAGGGGEPTSAPEPAQPEPIAEATEPQPEALPTEQPTAEPTASSEAPAQPQPPAGELLRQWAVSAEASSSYGTGPGNWSPQDATGEPDSEACYDDARAWASSASDGIDWLEVYYAQPVMATQINIHETYSPDQVVTVELIDADGSYYPVYQAQPVQEPDCALVLQIDLEANNVVTIGVRITVDQSVLGTSWNEIDAVELVGVPIGAPASGYQPAETGDGSSFEFTVTGCQEAHISGTMVEDNSTPEITSLILMETNSPNTMILLLPGGLDGEYYADIIPFDTSGPKPPTVMLYLDPATFYAQSGLYYIYPPENGLISGSVEFVAVQDSDPSCEIYVTMTFSQLPLPE